MAATRLPVKIFLASSDELKAERERIEQHISRLNNEWADDGIHLNLRLWEDANHGGSLRSQDDYHRDLAECGIFLMLFYSKVGKYTREEFDAAKKAHVEEGGLPKIYVFQKNIALPTDRTREEVNSRFDFLDELKEPGKEHFPFLFQTPDALITELDTRLRRLRKEGFFGLERKAVTSSPSSRFLTVVPHPGFVTGRDALLDAIHHALQTGGTAALVRGIGGIGKTTAALAYLHHDNYGSSYDHVAWVEILTTLPDAFAARRDLHERLGILPNVEALLGQNDFEGVVRVTLDALRRLNGQTLLALDNANDRDEIRRWKLALSDSGCRLLLTSRADIPNVAEVPVGELDPADAAALFWHYYRPNAPVPTEGEEAEAVARLLDEVQHHTLLVEMLGKIGKQAGMSVADLVKHVENGYVFSDKLQRTVATGSVIERKEAGLDESTLENLVLFLFQGLAPGLTDAERDPLRQIAVLPPTAYAPALLARLFGVADEEQTAFFNVLDAIDRRGVPLKKGDAYQLHRLVRAVALRELSPTPANCANVLQGVTDLLHIDQARDNPVDKFPFLGYGETLLEELKVTDGQHVSSLQANLALVYKALGNYEQARKMLEAALTSNLKHFGPDHPDTAIGQSKLATIYRYLGNYERAQEIGEAALNLVLKHFGPNHSRVAVVRSDLATVYRESGNYERARELAEAALASDLINFGPNHPAVAIRQSILSAVYQNLNNYERARELAEAALASDLNHFGPDHPTVAVRQSNLATVYSHLGDYGRARDLLEAALASDLNHFGPNHPNVAICQSNLATVYDNLGDYGRARDLLEAALATNLNHFGANHPNVAINYNNLGHIEIAEENWEAAKERLQQALAIGLKVWGKAQPNVQSTRQTLALVEAHLQKN